MISQIIDDKTAAKLRSLLDDSDRIVILTHMSPDGDAIGSSTAMQRILATMGKEARIVIPDMMLAGLRKLPGAKEAVDATRYPDFAAQLIADADLIICLDFNELSRIGRLAGHVEKCTAPKVLIDHHLNPSDFATLTISRPAASSTCYVLFKVLCGLELFGEIDRKTAECILTGMMTDTGNFSYNAADPRHIHHRGRVAAQGRRQGAHLSRTV